MNAATEFRFPFGDVVATPGADALLREHNVAPVRLLARHLSGDWGQVSSDDAQANEAAIVTGGRILSSYAVGGQTVWLITEGDRSATTFLLPCEY
ncbi:hypothetical protein [Zoogloea sp.]|uniref:hypothetical protein n=1 Tax=Zoogloea sp. TaxID=49181 RepID=UPI00261259FE|nr:hypothetical protein [Zoogloea sp.]MDD3353137.1 hypothetical protein [Zoogloea sp.]